MCRNLGIAIRENKRIERIRIFGYEQKISQYADDTTLVIKIFHSISGLKVNIEKTKVVQLGQVGGSRMINLEKEKLEYTDEFVLLGISI